MVSTCGPRSQKVVGKGTTGTIIEEVSIISQGEINAIQ